MENHIHFCRNVGILATSRLWSHFRALDFIAIARPLICTSTAAIKSKKQIHITFHLDHLIWRASSFSMAYGFIYRTFLRFIDVMDAKSSEVTRSNGSTITDSLAFVCVKGNSHTIAQNRSVYGAYTHTLTHILTQN